MVAIKKYRYRPVYKKFVGLRCNIQNKKKVFKFKRKKWSNLIFHLSKESKTRKRNCYYQFLDQNSYNISKFNNYFSKRYKQTVLSKKRFNLFYGSLLKKYIKRVVLNSKKKSNQIQNKINCNRYFQDNIEKRLDVILLKSHFVLSIRNARQLISHGHVLVNNNIVYESSFLVSQGDHITFSKNAHKLIRYYIALSAFWPLPPSYLQISYKAFSILVIDSTLLSDYTRHNKVWLNINNVTQFYKR